VTFDDVVVPHENLIGEEGGGWKQVGTELAFERSGPERYLSSSQLLLEMLDAGRSGQPPPHRGAGPHHGPVRHAAPDVAGCRTACSRAAKARRWPPRLVKDQGALVEQAMPDIAHDLFGGLADPDSTLAQAMAYTALAVPSFSLRGGTREILRGIIAKGLDLR
jgi:acyl-CoA dehydrogenase